MQSTSCYSATLCNHIRARFALTPSASAAPEAAAVTDEAVTDEAVSDETVAEEWEPAAAAERASPASAPPAAAALGQLLSSNGILCRRGRDDGSSGKESKSGCQKLHGFLLGRLFGR